MSFATGPDLTPAARVIESLMDDTCIITRNPLAQTDAAIDSSGFIVRTPSTVVYDETTLDDFGRPLLGRCKVSSLRDSQPTSQPGVGFADDVRFYKVAVPLWSPEVKIGDVIRVTSARRSSYLVGAIFDVREPKLSSFAVQLTLICERRLQILPGGATTPPELTFRQSGSVGAIAVEYLEPGRLVRLTGAGVGLFSASNLGHYDEAYGITLTTAEAGSEVVLMPAGGVATITGWGLTPDATYWADDNGLITAVAPLSGLVQPVGIAVDADTMFVNLSEGWVI